MDRGFTLLEVLLASALAVTLLMGVWSLLSMQTRLFAKTPARLEQSQLVRALYQQIGDDLHACLFIPQDDPAKVTRFLQAGSTGESAGDSAGGATGGPTGGGTGNQRPAEDLSPQSPGALTATVTAGGAGRPSALIGTAQSLHLQVLQVPLPQVESRTATGTLPEAAVDPQAGPELPELRDVSYTFYPPGLVGVDPLTYQAGLIRREIAWTEVDSQTGTASVPWIFRPESDDPATDPAATADDTVLAPASPADGEPATQRPPRDVTIYVPEVVGLEFRYYDGSGWSSSWDSYQRHALPAAVEVMVDFGNREATPTPAAAADTTAGAASTEAADEGASAAAEPSDLTTDPQPTLNPNVHRFVIFLPSGARANELPSSELRSSAAGTAHWLEPKDKAIWRVSPPPTPPHNVADSSGFVTAIAFAATLWGGGHAATGQQLPTAGGIGP